VEKKLAALIETLGIDRFSVPERLELIEQIWDSLPEVIGTEDVPAWHLAILEERIERLGSSTVAGRPWRETLARFGSDS
jgi:putative addiction module component (TIGR02574 family)